MAFERPWGRFNKSRRFFLLKLTITLSGSGCPHSKCHPSVITFGLEPGWVTASITSAPVGALKQGILNRKAFEHDAVNLDVSAPEINWERARWEIWSLIFKKARGALKHTFFQVFLVIQLRNKCTEIQIHAHMETHVVRSWDACSGRRWQVRRSPGPN